MCKNKPIRIAIIDDHQIFIDGIKSLLENEDTIELVGSAQNEKEIITILKNNNPDLVLVDLNLQTQDGLDIIPVIKSHKKSIKIIVITMYNDNCLVEKSFQQGVHGYLVKNTGKEELLEAIQSVFKGNIYKSPELFESEILNQIIIKDKYPDAFLKKYNLTKRETDIIILMAQSLSTKEIADKLYISELTVSTHRKHIKSKLKLKNTAAIVKFAFENKLL
jgi:DNA-binding NarL/FixJ family response regulator